MILLHRPEDRGGQRRDKHRESQPEHEQRRQDLAEVVGALIDTRQEQKAARGNKRPEAYQYPRPDAVGECAEAAESTIISEVTGKSASPA